MHYSDMRIQVTDTTTSENIELLGHEAPVLGLSLDPKEEFVVMYILLSVTRFLF